MTMIRRRIVIGLVLALALVASACGSDDGSDTTAAAPLATTTVAPATTAAPTTVATTFDLVAAVAEYESTIPEGWMSIGDTTAFKDAMTAGDPVVIDVREVSEYEAGHVEGAINIPLRTLSENLDKIPTDQQVLIYCKSGWRAGLGTSSLRMLGYDNVLAYAPGWNGWTAAGEPESTDAVTAATFEVPTIEPELFDAVNGFLTTIPEGWLTAGDAAAVQDAIAADAAVIDIRSEGEYADGYIAPAVNITLRTITDNMDAIPTDTQAIAYCKSGWRASLSIPVFHVLGFDNVRGFSGSYLAWTEAGLPIETP